MQHRNILNRPLVALALLSIIFVIFTNLNTNFISFASTNRTVEVKITAGKANTNQSQLTYQFLPPAIYVKNGDTVKWFNYGNANHTVDSIFFNSGTIYPENSKKPSTFSFKFTRSGTYVYFDNLHPEAGGVIYVNSSETQRELVPTSANLNPEVRVEMPQGSAYKNYLGSFFIPSFLNLSQGTKVIWTNKDYIPHTATAADGSFDSKPILTGRSVSEVMKIAGMSTYYCKIHPWMVGTLQVNKRG